MKTDIDHIGTKLKQYNPSVYVRSPRYALINSVEILTPEGDHYKSDILYISDNSALSESTFSANIANLLCRADTAIQPWLYTINDLNLIVLESDISLETISQIVEEITVNHRRFSTVMEDLVDALYYGRGLQAIADIGFELFGNPITIVDTSFKSLAFSSNVEIEDLIVRKNMASGYLDEDSIQSLKKQRLLDKVCQSRVPIMQSSKEAEEYSSNLGYGWIISAVRIHGMVVAYFSVYGACVPFGPYDTDWVSQLVKLASIELQKNEFFIHNNGIMYESLLHDLLEENITDKQVILKRLKAIDRTLGDDLYVVTARQIQDNEITGIMPAEGQAMLRSILKQSMSLVYKADIVFLVSRNAGEPLFKKDNKELISFLKNNQLKIGVSNLFSNVVEMKNYYKQACKALDLGIPLNPQADIFLYSKYAVYHALEICAQSIDLRDLCHPGLLKLNESTEPGDRELLHTLYLYLMYLKDATKVADVLHIHKNTLYYRLNKTKKYINENLESGNTVFELIFSYKLMEYVASFWPQDSPLPDHSFIFETPPKRDEIL